jgi:hypothetical protein
VIIRALGNSSKACSFQCLRPEVAFSASPDDMFLGRLFAGLSRHLYNPNTKL